LGLILINPEEEELKPPAGVAFLGCGIILTKINIKTKIHIPQTFHSYEIPGTLPSYAGLPLTF
jgi:hypothetical protein